MRIYIKNMVCDRCKTMVESALNKLGIQFLAIKIGEVHLEQEISSTQRSRLASTLLLSGFELIDEERNILIEKLKKSVTELEQYSDEDLKMSHTDFISQRVDDSFISLNKLFAEIKGVTIEKYIIKRKIERIKEMLVYEEVNLDEIATTLQ